MIDIFLRIGFIFGGVFVIVIGYGFSDNMLEVIVNMGYVFCYVFFSMSSKIVCEIDVFFKVYKVDNSGSYLGKIMIILIFLLEF